MSLEQFSVTWDSFQSNIKTGMNNLLENEDFVDVTLAVEGRHLKAHKMVLSMCSSYFRDLFKTSPCKHPIVFMKDVSHDVMSDLLQFMYKGEVQVSEDKFTTFIKTAESLQIKGLRELSDHRNNSTECTEQNNSIEQEIAKSRNSETFFHTYAKRPRLSESPPQPATTVKSEAEESTITNEVELKTEPIDQENSSNCSDDFLDEAIADDTNEDFWMMEGLDELQSGTSGNDPLKGVESISSDVEEAAVSSRLPERSRDRYESAFSHFEKWCSEHGFKTINEDVLLAYFKQRLLTYKPSSLWSFYSMLKSMISIKKNQDISTYSELLVFLKKQSRYPPKKFKEFKRADLEKFLKDADNNTYLMMKVAMIIGIAGGCRREDLVNLRVEDVEDGGNFMQFRLLDSQTNSRREFIVTAGNIEGVNMLDIIRSYMKLRPAKMSRGRFFICYQNGKCIKQAVGINTLGAMPKNIAQFLGLEKAEQFTAHCFRRNSKELRKCVNWLGTRMKK